MGAIELYNGSRFDVYDSTINGTLLASGNVGGLVGSLYSDSYQNLQFIDLHNQASISGGDSLGGLIGSAITDNGDIEISDSSSTGTISSGDASAGGLVGYTSDDGGETSLAIDRSYVRATITSSSDYAGGLVGNADIAVHVADSYFNGQLTGLSFIGGLIGYTSNGGSSIDNSYAVGSITSSDYQLGGLAGEYAGSISDSFAAVHLTSDQTTVGGLVGAFDGGPTDNNYVDMTAANKSCGGALAPETSLACIEVNADGNSPDYFKGNKTNQPLNNWNFTTTWGTVPNDYPELKWARALNPAEISTCEDLQNIQNDLGSSYVLTQDIDCSDTATWNDGNGFVPIGNDFNDGFAGTLNGAGYTISHLHSNSQFGVGGIFASTTGATIRNLNVSQSDVSAEDLAGTIVGLAQDTTLSNIRVNGKVTVTDEMFMPGAGGIVGAKIDTYQGTHNSRLAFSGNVTGRQNAGGIFGISQSNIMESPILLSESYSTGTVTGTWQVGGLIGSAGLTFVSNSYSTSNIIGNNRIGGLAGDAGFSTFTSTYTSGLVRGTGEDVNAVGGFVGYSYYIDITNSFQTGMVLAPGGVPAAGMVGTVDPETSVSTSYAYFNDINTSCVLINDMPDNPEGCYSRYNAELPNLYFGQSGQGPVDQWDFDETWSSRMGGLPQLQWSHPSNVISTCQDLQNIQNDMSADYSIVSDIDCSDTINWNDGAGFRPMGDDINQFTGTLNGNGHTITGLFIHNTTGYAGMFYRTDGARIDNLQFENASITGDPVAGVLAAYTYRTSIDSVYIRDSVVRSTGTDAINSVTGGLVATLGNYGSITRSYFEGAVEGLNRVGGLTGWSAGSSNVIQDSYARADVLGQNVVGGLIGRMQGGLVQYTYSTGTVTATGNEDGQWAGGLIGYMTSLEAVLADNFTNSEVSAPGGSAENANALVGYAEDPLNTGWSYNVYNPTHADPEAGEYACATSPDGYYYNEACYSPAPASLDSFFYQAGNAPMFNWVFGGLWHENYNDYPTLQPLTEPQIECEQAVRTSTTAQVTCGVTPYGWGTTTWEMYYKETGKDASTEVTLNDIHQAHATITGLDPSKDYTVYFRFTNDWGTSEWCHIDYPHLENNDGQTHGSQKPDTTSSSPIEQTVADITLPATITNVVQAAQATNTSSKHTNGSSNQKQPQPSPWALILVAPAAAYLFSIRRRRHE